METNTITGKIYIAIDWIVKLVFINILFIICNIPTIITFLNYLIAQTSGQLIFALTILGLTTIFCTFPAMMAVFGTIRALTIDGRTTRTFRVFIRTYKENYKRSITGGALFTLITFSLTFYYYFLNIHDNTIAKYITYAIIIYYIMIMMHFFSSNTHTETTFIQNVKNAVLLTMKNPVLSFLCGFMVVFTVLISIKIPILFILMTAPIIAYISFQIYYKRSIRGLTTD